MDGTVLDEAGVSQTLPKSVNPATSWAAEQDADARNLGDVLSHRNAPGYHGRSQGGENESSAVHHSIT
jgi:hypothetical protein